MKPRTTEEILNGFDPCDRDLVTNPDLEHVEWGELDYLSWFHESGSRAFLCAEFKGRLVGVVLRLSDRQGSKSGICHLCLGGDGQVGTRMVMADSFAKPRHAYGIHICRGLDCSAAVRGIRNRGALRETLPSGQKVERLQMRLERFLQKVTGL